MLQIMKFLFQVPYLIHGVNRVVMKNYKQKLLIGAVILTLGIMVAIPVFADLEEDELPTSGLYYLDEATGEYMPWYPRWYDPENPDSYTPPEECPWWNPDTEGEYDWMPHWGRRGSIPEEPWGYGYRNGGCGGYGYRSNRYQTN